MCLFHIWRDACCCHSLAHVGKQLVQTLPYASHWDGGCSPIPTLLHGVELAEITDESTDEGEHEDPVNLGS